MPLFGCLNFNKFIAAELAASILFSHGPSRPQYFATFAFATETTRHGKWPVALAVSVIDTSAWKSTASVPDLLCHKPRIVDGWTKICVAISPWRAGYSPAVKDTEYFSIQRWSKRVEINCGPFSIVWQSGAGWSDAHLLQWASSVFVLSYVARKANWKSDR